MHEIKTMHGYKVIEHVGTDTLKRVVYRYHIASPTIYNHDAGEITPPLTGGLFQVVDGNTYEVELFPTIKQCREWLLNRIDRALVNETPFGGYCPDIPY